MLRRSVPAGFGMGAEVAQAIVELREVGQW
jgi:hypothetical protein